MEKMSVHGKWIYGLAISTVTLLLVVCGLLIALTSATRAQLEAEQMRDEAELAAIDLQIRRFETFALWKENAPMIIMGRRYTDRPSLSGDIEFYIISEGGNPKIIAAERAMDGIPFGNPLTFTPKDNPVSRKQISPLENF